MPVTDLRQIIINAVSVRMAAITIAAGYYNTIVKIFDNKPENTEFENADMPAINISDRQPDLISIETQGQYNYQTYILNVNLDFTGKPSSVANAAQMARQALADMKKAVNTDLTWSGNAITTYQTAGTNEEIKIEQEKTLIASALLKIQIYYRTKQWLEA